MRIFLHIPKTAGTSISTCLSNKYNLLKLSGLDLHNINIDDLNNYDYISGHFCFDSLPKNIDCQNIFTILRNPIDRLKSLWNFLNDLYLNDKDDCNPVYKNEYIDYNYREYIEFYKTPYEFFTHKDIMEINSDCYCKTIIGRKFYKNLKDNDIVDACLNKIKKINFFILEKNLDKLCSYLNISHLEKMNVSKTNYNFTEKDLNAMYNLVEKDNYIYEKLSNNTII